MFPLLSLLALLARLGEVSLVLLLKKEGGVRWRFSYPFTPDVIRMEGRAQLPESGNLPCFIASQVQNPYPESEHPSAQSEGQGLSLTNKKGESQIYIILSTSKYLLSQLAWQAETTSHYIIPSLVVRGN